MSYINYFTPTEVALHNHADDIWLSVSGLIYNLTSLIQEYGLESPLSKPLLIFAGKDVSHWFNKNPVPEEFVHYTDIHTGSRLPFAAHGLVPHAEEGLEIGSVPWWRDAERLVGRVTAKLRPVRVVNTLTGQTTLLQTCCEDTCARIFERYKQLGYNVENYTWYAANTGLALKPEATLEENGLHDECDYFIDLGLPCDTHIPALLLYYNDVITQPLPIEMPSSS